MPNKKKIESIQFTKKRKRNAFDGWREKAAFYFGPDEKFNF